MKKYKLEKPFKKVADGWEIEYSVWVDCYCNKVIKKGILKQDRTPFMKDIRNYDSNL